MEIKHEIEKSIKPKQKQTYSMFTKNTFKDAQFESDEQAKAEAVKAASGIVKVLRHRGSVVIWEAEKKE